MAEDETPKTTEPPETPPPASPTKKNPSLDPLIYCQDDGKRWQDKFYGQQGLAEQYRRELEKTKGTHSAETEALRGDVTARDTQISQLVGQVEELQTVSATVPELQERITQLTSKAGQADKYRMLMDYPGLLQLQVEETVPGEEGEDPVKVMVNPVLNLIEHSTLEGDALKAEIARLAQLYKAPAEPKPETTTKRPPEVPPAPKPSTDTIDSVFQQMTEVRERVLMNEPGAKEEYKALVEKHRALVKEQARKGG